MNEETDIKPNVKLAVPFFMVSDMEHTLSFYLDGLGFKMRNKWTPLGKIEWCWLERDSVALMFQETRKINKNADGSDEKKGVGVSVCFQCEDALALYHEFNECGLTVKEPFVGNNRWVGGLNDPDGYNIEFESVTDVPEETMYSEWIARS